MGVLSVGANILKGVVGVGKGLLGGIKGIFSSGIGKAAVIGGGAALIINAADKANQTGSTEKSSGFSSFIGSLKSSVENVIGGAAGLLKGIVGKITNKTSEKDSESKSNTDFVNAIASQNNISTAMPSNSAMTEVTTTPAAETSNDYQMGE